MERFFLILGLEKCFKYLNSKYQLNEKLRNIFVLRLYDFKSSNFPAIMTSSLKKVPGEIFEFSRKAFNDQYKEVSRHIFA